MKILVIGDSCRDVFVYGSVSRICPEAPVPVFNPISVVSNDGMAGNVVANLKSLGADVDLITNQETVIKKRIVDKKSNQMIVRIDEGDSVKNAFDIDDVDFDKYSCVVISDYNKGFLKESDIFDISLLAKVCFLDTKKVLGQFAYQCKYIKINESEWNNCERSGQKYDEWKRGLIITMSEKGAKYNDEMIPVENEVECRDVSGAGDTFLAGLVYEYVNSFDIIKAIKFANLCASKVVTKKGVSVI